MSKHNRFVFEKSCPSCKNIYPNTIEYYHWDKRLYKGEGGTVATCKTCKNKNKPEQAKQRRIKLSELGIKEHLAQYKKHRERILNYHKKEYVVKNRKAKCKLRRKNNPEKFRTKEKAYRSEHKKHLDELRKEYDKKAIDNLKDSYIAQLASNYLGLTRKEVQDNKDLLEAYRCLVKIKRLTKYNNQNLVP